jgi:hypothetical protein
MYSGDLPGIIPPEYYADMEKVGTWTSFYELV